ncbi:MAG TPA: hypothetical protein VNP72_02000, partial [Longimicrobium sp.]|nr:hypothetical protein [Longimicrobium sp.]
HLVFDCRSADNIILRDLSFKSDGTSDPHDCITIDATRGRHGKGFWIDHCEFEAYFDMNIVTNTRDQVGEPPLLITVSHCRFRDRDPGGGTDHGALGIHGSDQLPAGADQRTNAYATVYRNVFSHVRRRSPRSSHRTVVHAVNNILDEWGTSDLQATQQNGMDSGNFGLLVAEANYFKANVLKTAITVAGGSQPARLTVPGDGPRENKYRNDAVEAVTVGDPIDIAEQYRTALGAGASVPNVEKITPELRTQIEAQAGPRAT